MSRWSRVTILGAKVALLCAFLIAGPNTPAVSHEIAQPVPVAARSTNPYWAGYVMTSTPGYVAIRATWTVPRIPCPIQPVHDATVYAWIGEGGYVDGISDPLIQTGTASDCFLGTPRYHAFYEWYPGIYATDFPIAVAAGDSVTASVVETQWGVWTLTLRDNTDGQQYAVSTTASVDARSAEFIVERPTVCAGANCGQVALGRFRSMTFRDVQTLADPGTRPQQMSIALVDGNHRRLAVPGRTPSLSRSFSVLWREPY